MLWEACPHYHFGLGLPTEEVSLHFALVDGLVSSAVSHESHHLLVIRICRLRREIIAQTVQNLRYSIDILGVVPAAYAAPKAMRELSTQCGLRAARDGLEAHSPNN